MTVIAIDNVALESIDASTNIRRACKKLANKGINVWNMFLRLALSNNTTDNFEYIKTMIEHEPELVRLALSINKMGQINPVIGRKFGPIYKVIAGQRRCLAVALLESIRRVTNYGDESMIDTVMAMCQDYDFAFNLIQENEEGYFLQVKVVDISDDDAERISFDENDQSMPISDLDWGYDFDRLSKTINPATGKNYNFKEIAVKRSKPYQFVVGRAALPYLPKDWQEKLDEGVLNITECINYAKDLRDAAETGKIMPVTGVVPSVVPMDDVEITAPLADTIVSAVEESGAASSSGKSWTTATRKPRSKKKVMDRMTREDILNILSIINPTEKVAIGVIAQILFITEEQAEAIANGSDKIEKYL